MCQGERRWGPHQLTGRHHPTSGSSCGGYERAEVDRFVAQLLAQDGYPPSTPPRFTIVLRGYDRAEVDAFLARFAPPAASPADAGSPGVGSAQPVDLLPPPDFRIVLRGYERAEVDWFVAQLLAHDGHPPPAPPKFTIVLRGYDPAEVDRFVEQALTGGAGEDRRLQDGMT